jgi:phosphopantetheinyl transferase (holo-ACP synthase)
MTTKLADLKKEWASKEAISKEKQCNVKGGCGCEDRRRPGRRGGRDGDDD